MPRNPFAFLDDVSPTYKLTLILCAILKKQGDISLDLTDLTSVDDSASFNKSLDDSGSRIVLRYARKGAEAFFLRDADADSQPSTRLTPTRRPTSPSAPSVESPSPTPRHAIHDDVDLALRESQMAEHAERVQRERLRQARAETGALPWTIRRPQ